MGDRYKSIFFGSWVSTTGSGYHLHNRVTCTGLSTKEERKLQEVVSTFTSHPSMAELRTIVLNLPNTAGDFDAQSEKRRRVLGKLLREAGCGTWTIEPIQSEEEYLRRIK